MTVAVGILGLGTVGTGTVQVLRSPAGRHPLLQTVQIARVGVRDLTKPREVDLPSELFTTDLDSIVADPEIDVIIEVIGGIEPARTLILQAINHKKHVITANKALLARYGAEIFSQAMQNQVYVMLEAAVAGGIPVIQTLKQALGANRLTEVVGIINGTTNYILTQMQEKDEGFGEALAEAQRLGYAEADPTADIEGEDAADKIAILASLAFGERINREEVYCEGITQITKADMHYAHEFGYVIKLLGIGRKTEMGIDVRVHPALVPQQHRLAAIAGVINAVQIVGEPIGELLLAGAGAGGGATASAIVADLINIIAAQGHPFNPLLGCWHEGYAKVMPIANLQTQYYLRTIVADVPGVIGEIGAVLGNQGVSIRTIVQKDIHDGLADIAIMTQTVREGQLQGVLEEMRHLPAVKKIPIVLRVVN
ncbi:MAG: homoserine dehydrogenase [Pseudanabaenaceae cyanobacterium]